jgi:hypothetical protein
MGRHRTVVALCALALPAACSVVLNQDATQCQSDGDCAQFSGMHCDTAQRICVASVLAGNGGEQGGSGVSGSSSQGSGGSGNDAGAGGSVGEGGAGGTADASLDAPDGAGLSAGQAGTGTGGTGDSGHDPCIVAQKPLVEVSSNITQNFTLSCDKEYVLIGIVFVDSGVTLTVQPGTTIKGSPQPNPGILVVRPGARLLAAGTAARPIVFTSAAAEGARKPGDWGGVILLGRAPSNHRDAGGMPTTGNVEGLTSGGDYGGPDPNDNSGVLKYVRIEYSGVAIAPNNEVNGLTFGGVGRATTVDHVQVRHTADDCFEFFGGTVNAKYLVCHMNGDDGFDWDNGYAGKLQFLALQQDPSVADETNGFEGDNDALGSANTPLSAPTIYNATLCGKNADPAKQQYGMLLRRGTRATIANTIAMGFEAGIDIRDAATQIDLKSSIFFGNVVKNVAYEEDGSNTETQKDDDALFNELTWFATAANKNSESDPGIVGCFSADGPNFAPPTALAGNAATPPNDGFFDTTATYVGAFRNGGDRWATESWIVWSER